MKKSVIVNPSAGWGSAGRKWPELESRLKSLHGEFETHFTRGPGDAVQITRRLLLNWNGKAARGRGRRHGK